MSSSRLVVADSQFHRAQLLALNVEYMTWVGQGVDRHFGIDSVAMVGGSVAAYVESSIDKVCPPPADGVYYLLEQAGETIGMGALRRIGADVGEIKRMYVRPEERGHGHGVMLLEALLAQASARAYRRVCLDSAPFMTAAHALYRRFGFTDRAAYAETEVPQPLRAGWLFMEKQLA
jgi:GNAT superfamily N-acetyltransferase